MQVGHPLAVQALLDDGSGSSQSTCRASDTDTDIEFQFLSHICDPKLPCSLGVAKTRVCLVCLDEIFSGLALIQHLKQFHKGVWPYKCESCDSAFNNLKEMSSHRANVHRPREVQYKHCDHTMTTRAKMWQHVHKHTKGFQCMTCHCSFQSKRLLIVHKRLHQQCQHFDCDECDNFYYTQTLLCLHKKGKHGPGYPCVCSAVFATPNQWKRHKKYCQT